MILWTKSLSIDTLNKYQYLFKTHWRSPHQFDEPNIRLGFGNYDNLGCTDCNLLTDHQFLRSLNWQFWFRSMALFVFVLKVAKCRDRVAKLAAVGWLLLTEHVRTWAGGRRLSVSLSHNTASRQQLISRLLQRNIRLISADRPKLKKLVYPKLQDNIFWSKLYKKKEIQIKKLNWWKCVSKIAKHSSKKHGF